MQAKKAPITSWNAADLGVDTALVGMQSATRAVGHEPPPPRPPAEMLDGEPEQVAEKLFEKLRGAQVI
jgi:electron transfer flavoprotein alpha/beta subunit